MHNSCFDLGDVNTKAKGSTSLPAHPAVGAIMYRTTTSITRSFQPPHKYLNLNILLSSIEHTFAYFCTFSQALSIARLSASSASVGFPPIHLMQQMHSTIATKVTIGYKSDRARFIDF